jgi:hypothetical protein
MRQGSSPRRPVIADSQHGEDPTPKTDISSQRVGNFSEQVWGVSTSVVMGTTIISITQPGGFLPPAGKTSVVATVDP